MNQHLHSPTKLTEFARDFENEPETFLVRVVNKIHNAYNQGYNTVNEVSSAKPASKSNFYTDSSPSTSNTNPSESSSVSLNNRPTSLRTATNLNANGPLQNVNPQFQRAGSEGGSIAESSNTESDKNEDPNQEGRTMLAVLKRLSNLMASKNSNLRDYKDTDLHRLWMPDSKAKECYDCSQKFSTFRRKHHCRLCGQIFCSKCCSQVVPGKIIMCSGDLKVCNYCSKIVLSYLKSPNIAKELQSDLQALQHDLTTKLEDETKKEDSPPLLIVPQRKASLGYQEERFATYHGNSLSENDRKNILQQSNSLISLHEQMQKSLPSQNCGTSLIEFLNTHHKAANKVQATAILGAMLAAGFLQPIVPDSEQTEFDENLHYRFNSLPKNSMENLDCNDDKNNSEVSSPQFDATNSEPQPPKSIDISASTLSVEDDNLENTIKWTIISSKFIESYCYHEDQLLIQMLKTYQLDLDWSKELTALCSRAANQFKPDYCTSDLWDIRNYINFKKVPGGKREKCTIVGGVVFSKNVAHKDMATKIENPRILLLQCPIVYERIEGKFVSISTVLLQEEEYLRNVCARIMSFHPNIVIVHKNVAGIAQDMLKAKGITLVIDVKISVMERLARTLQCDILTSIESNIARPQLGYCNAFYIQNFNNGSGSGKTLMFFEVLTSPRGFTCLLRGGSNRELAKVKKVAQFLVYARYNWRLEMSFLMDEFAQPLEPPPPIFDSKDTSPNENEHPENDEALQLRNNLKRKGLADRKSEDKILTAITENVTDNTDPLRSTNVAVNQNNSNGNAVVKLAVENRYDNRFRNALSSIILSASPFMTFPLPYLETEQGRKCALRSLFPSELYFSKLWSNRNSLNADRHESLERKKLLESNNNENELKDLHPFLKTKITGPIGSNKDLQTKLAEFRSFGGRYTKKKKMFKTLNLNETYQKPQKVKEEQVYKDALDIENHQRLPILFCSFYSNPKSASSFCAPPTLLDMKFYGPYDIMLGQFLQRYCCVLTSICRLCKLPMLGHVRRYVHSMGCVQVFLSEDTSKNDPNRIYFSAWCSICNAVTPSVPISSKTQCLSFAKYLELRFHGHAYKSRSLDETSEENDLKSKCEHSLHRDYVHYFSFRGVGAKFQYTPIEVWEISLPSLVINLHASKDFDQFKVLEEIKNYAKKGHEIYTRIHERIADLATEDEHSPLLNELKTTLSKDQFIFKQYIEIIQTLLTDKRTTCYDLNDAMIMSKKVLAESIDLWGPRLNEIALAQKAAAKSVHVVDTAIICSEDSKSENLDHSPIISTESPRFPNTLNTTDASSQNDVIPEENPASIAQNLNVTLTDKKLSTEQFLNIPDKKTIKKILTNLLPSTSPTNPLQSPFSSQEHYTLPLGAFPVQVRDTDLSSIIAYSLTSPEYQRLIGNLTSSNVNHSSPDNQSSQGNSSPNPARKPNESSQAENDENSKATSTTSSNNSTTDAESKNKHHSSHIEVAFHDNGTYFNCKIYFAKEFDCMRAKSLKPPDVKSSVYKEYERNKKREEIKISQSRTCHEMELVRKPSDASSRPPPPSLNNQKSQEIKTECQILQEDIDDSRNYLARSLCSSVVWEARGGKSGSRFSKTSDDRFVLKEMNKPEMNFFENFVSNYFDYINKCQQKNQPTLLTKIFGIFKVTIKKKDSSSISEKSLLVMENLFYDCDIKRKFDLKGSERNRLVDTTNQEGEIVLLDENLVQMSWSQPLYILSHSKAVLKDAINRDSSFLERNQVMDYSLLVGLDNKNSVLVLGIIDYIRTFTFDKKVESFVKQTGLLGGMGKLPTVIPPERYKQRFTVAMDRYFYTVPDRWEGLSKI